MKSLSHSHLHMPFKIKVTQANTHTIRVQLLSIQVFIWIRFIATYLKYSRIIHVSSGFHLNLAYCFDTTE